VSLPFAMAAKGSRRAHIGRVPAGQGTYRRAADPRFRGLARAPIRTPVRGSPRCWASARTCSIADTGNDGNE